MSGTRPACQASTDDTDPRPTADKPLRDVNNVNIGQAGAAQIEPEQRWAVLASRLDQRLVGQGDWPALAQLIAHLGPGGGQRGQPLDTSTTKTATPARSQLKAPASSATAREPPSR